MKKAYWWPAQNFGDTLTPIVIEYLSGVVPEHAARNESGRILGIGSIIHLVRENDIVFGSGSNRPGHIINSPEGARYLCVRGPLTRAQIKGATVPEIYGDPAILLPRIYSPEVKKTHAIGYLPHYVDKKIVMSKYAIASGYSKHIDIQADWKTVIEEVLSCEKIVASSLHGIIVAEAYGIPAVWEQYSDKIVGGDFKFQDYFLGTGREEQRKGETIPAIPNLSTRQDALEEAFRQEFPNV